MEGIEQIIPALTAADKSATLAVNSVNSPLSDSIWLFISQTEVWIPLYAVVLFFIFKRLGWRKAVVGVLAIVLTITACDQCSNLFKYMACRMRPCNDGWMLEHGLNALEPGGLYGFFSAHAANSFGFASSSTLVFRYDKSGNYKLYGRLTMIWAALVSLSRVFVGKHYIGDIVVGTLVGLFFGWVMASIGAAVIDRCFNKNQASA